MVVSPVSVESRGLGGTVFLLDLQCRPTTTQSSQKNRQSTRELKEQMVETTVHCRPPTEGRLGEAYRSKGVWEVDGWVPTGVTRERMKDGAKVKSVQGSQGQETDPGGSV